MKSRSTSANLTFCTALVAALLLAAPVFAQEASAPAAAPSAVVDEPVFDAGRVSKGADVVHDFVIRNEGTAPLTISEVRPACGCTVADYDETIAPGESGKINAVVDTTDFSGGISKGLTVFTNDPANPRLVLTVKARIEPSVFIRPGFARFIQPQFSEPGTVDQILFTRSFDDLKVLKVESPYPFLDVKARPATEDEKQEDGSGNQWVLEMTLDYGTAEIGPLAEYVRVTTNHPEQTEVAFPVSGYVRPMVVPTPARLDLGSVSVSADSLAKTSVVLKNYAQEALDIEVAGATVAGLDVEVEEIEEGREFRVHVRLGADMPMGAFDGVIRLNTGHPKNPTIEIPISGTRI